MNALFYGNEPYRLMKQRELVKKVEHPEMNLHVTDVFDQEVLEIAFQMPFFAPFRVIVVELENCMGTETLIKYLQKPVATTNVYVFVEAFDSRSLLRKAFPQDAVYELNKFTDRELDEMIRRCVAGHGKQITLQALRILKERLQYCSDEVNFFDVGNEVNKLCAMADDAVDAELVERAIPQHEKENVFHLMQMVLNMQKERLFHEAELILGSKDSNAIQVLSLMLRSYRISYKAALLGRERQQEIGVHPKAVLYLPIELCTQSMDCIQEAVTGIKTGKYQERDALVLCFSKLVDYVKQFKNQLRK